MNNLWQDLKYSARMLRTRRGFTIASVLSLALGIGTCTSIFSVVDGVLLRPLPYPESERIVALREVNDKGARMPIAEPNYLDVRERNRSLDSIAQYAGEVTTVTGGSEPVRTGVYAVSSDFFRVLAMQPAVGRTFTEEESRSGARVAVVSYGFWKRLLGGANDLAAATLKIEGESLNVIGVMPPALKFPRDAEVWVPREIFPPQTSRTAHNWRVIARLAGGVMLDQARADVSAIGRGLREQYGEGTDAVDFALIPLQKYMTDSVRDGLVILLAAVAFLLTVACANVANMLMAQATARHKEFAVRVALGASRWRLARQFITESALLAFIAGAAGVLLAVWGVDFLLSLTEGFLPRADEIGVDSRALLFTLGLALAVAFGIGLAPALRFPATDLQAGLKESGRDNSAGPVRQRLRALLVVAQVAMTMVLLVGAGLLIRGFLKLLEVDPGFRTDSVVAMELSLPPAESEKQDRALADFHRLLIERLGNLPGVAGVGSINSMPMSGGGSNGQFLINDDPNSKGYAEYRKAARGYFQVMGIRLLRGREFDESDAPNSPPAALISESLAARYWPDEDPVGKRIQFGNMDGDRRLLLVVGVVSDVRDYGLDETVRPTVYANALQRPQPSELSVVVRSSIDAAALIPSMRGIAQEMSRDIPVNFKTIEEIFSSSLSDRRFNLVIFATFAVTALMLAVTGIYGVMSYTVTQRTNEIGVRMALGAEPRNILKMILGQGAKLSLIGVGIGVVASLMLTRLIESMIYEVSATDPVTFVAVAALLTLVATFACYIPARRAVQVDPMVALRYE